jgi:hypothetical protein
MNLKITKSFIVNFESLFELFDYSLSFMSYDWIVRILFVMKDSFIF